MNHKQKAALATGCMAATALILLRRWSNPWCTLALPNVEIPGTRWNFVDIKVEFPLLMVILPLVAAGTILSLLWLDESAGRNSLDG